MSSSPPPTVSWESPEPQGGPAPGIEFAPHGPRLVAYILDGILISVIILALLAVGFVILAAGTTIEGDEITDISTGAGTAFLLLFLASFVIGFLYFPFFWARGGQTPGMRPFRLWVVRDADGSPIGWGTALLRLVGLWVAGAVLYIGFIWVFIDKRHRGWQDLIAGTVVVRKP